MVAVSVLRRRRCLPAIAIYAIGEEVHPCDLHYRRFSGFRSSASGQDSHLRKASGKFVPMLTNPPAATSCPFGYDAGILYRCQPNKVGGSCKVLKALWSTQH
jgi:hypothetical protein